MPIFRYIVPCIFFFITAHAAMRPIAIPTRHIPSLKEMACKVWSESANFGSKNNVYHILADPGILHRTLPLPQELMDFVAQQVLKNHPARNWFNELLKNNPVEGTIVARPQHSPFSLAIDHYNKRLLIGSLACTIDAWSLESPFRCMRHMPVQYPARWMHVNSTTHDILVSGRNNDTPIHTYNIEDPKPYQVVIEVPKITAVAYCSSQQLIATGTDDGIICLLDANTQKNIITFEENHEGQRVWSVAFNSNGLLLASGASDRHVKIWNAITYQLVTDIDFGRPVNRIAFSPDGSYFAVGAGMCIYLYSCRQIGSEEINPTNALKKIEHDYYVRELCFNPSSTLLASGWSNGSILLFSADLETNKIRSFSTNRGHGHTQSIHNLMFLAESNMLLSASRDGTVRLWNPGLFSLSSVSMSQALLILAAYYAHHSGHRRTPGNPVTIRWFHELPTFWQTVLAQHIGIKTS